MHKRAPHSSLQTRRGYRRVSQLLIAAIVAIAVGAASVPLAGAHAELLQASPRRGATVGGSFHQIILQFGALDLNADHDVRLFDPAGNEIGSPAVREDNRIVIPIEPLDVPGVYRVTFDVLGTDGDQTQGDFGFRFEPGAAEPEPITIGLPADEGLDFVALALAVAFAAVAAFFVQRVWTAVRDHRAARRDPDVDPGG